MVRLPISTEEILRQLERILASPQFEGAVRSRQLLQFIVEQTVHQPAAAERLKEYTIGVEALQRGESFDPRTDPIVRAEASRLRARLERYYASKEGRDDSTLILLPKGSYVPQFDQRSGEKQPVHVSQPAPTGQNFRWTTAILIVCAAAAAFAIGVAVARRLQPATPEAPFAQFDVQFAVHGTISGYVAPALALSRDGTRLVFASVDPDGATRLNIRRLDQSEVHQLPETEGARGPFLSPDGRWVGFFASGKLKKMPVDGGSPQVLCELSDINGASWSEDGSIVAAAGSTLLRVPSSGGTPAVLLDLAKESVHPAWPQVLPGAQAALFTTLGFAGPNHAAIESITFATGKRRTLARGGTFGRLLPGPFLTYINQGTLFAMPANPESGEPRGAAIPLLEGVSYSSTFGYADLDFAQTGLFVYRKDQGGGTVAVAWLDSKGHAAPLLKKPGHFLWPRLHTDGNRLALSATESGESKIAIYDISSGQFTQLSSPSGPAFTAWSPNSRYLILGGSKGLYWTSADHPQQLRPLTHSAHVQTPWSFTPDGTRLAFHELSPTTGFDLWTVPLRESSDGLTAGTPEPFLRTPAFETYAAFSPDGRWIAYGANETGTWEVYVRAFPDNGTKVQVSTAGGRIPLWSRRANELLYRTDDQRIFSAHYSTETGLFVVQSVKLWTSQRLADTGVLANLDLAPDGRIAALTAIDPGEPAPALNHLTFLLNFPAEIRRRSAAPGK